jgi:transposase-like protein
MRKNRHSGEFNATDDLEAMKGVKNVRQLAKEFQVYPMQVTQWKNNWPAK